SVDTTFEKYLSGPGDDSLTGGAGDETFVPDGGNNTVNGGGGTDTLDRSADTLADALTVNADGSFSLTHASTDTGSAVEKFSLSSAGDTVNDNHTAVVGFTFFANAGNDT